ncbi:MAG: lipopolysaccharide biosynthesis protein, partial [Pirellulaceae bacterium]
MDDSTDNLASAKTDSGTAAPIPELKVDSLKFGIMFALVLTAIQRIVGLVRGILFCRILPEEQLGQWSLTWSYLMLLAPLAVLGLPGSFNRYVETYRQSGQLRSFLVRIALVSSAATILFSGVLYFAAEPVAHLLYRDVAQAPLV